MEKTGRQVVVWVPTDGRKSTLEGLTRRCGDRELQLGHQVGILSKNLKQEYKAIKNLKAKSLKEANSEYNRENDEKAKKLMKNPYQYRCMWTFQSDDTLREAASERV